jgi:hypothetical protein
MANWLGTGGRPSLQHALACTPLRSIYGCDPPSLDSVPQKPGVLGLALDVAGTAFSHMCSDGSFSFFNGKKVPEYWIAQFEFFSSRCSFISHIAYVCGLLIVYIQPTEQFT